MEASKTTENKINQKQWSTKKLKLAQELKEMGFSELLVKEFVDNVDDDDLSLKQCVKKLLTASSEPIENIPVVEDDGDELWEDVTDYGYMMVIVINVGLNMGVGKTASQAVHAALGLHEVIYNLEHLTTGLINWNSQGCPKIVVEVNNTKQLLSVCSEGKIRKIPFFCVYDFGLKLEVKLISFTASAFFGTTQELDHVIGHLKELN